MKTFKKNLSIDRRANNLKSNVVSIIVAQVFLFNAVFSGLGYAQSPAGQPPYHQVPVRWTVGQGSVEVNDLRINVADNGDVEIFRGDLPLYYDRTLYDPNAKTETTETYVDVGFFLGDTIRGFRDDLNSASEEVRAVVDILNRLGVDEGYIYNLDCGMFMQRHTRVVSYGDTGGSGQTIGLEDVEGLLSLKGDGSSEYVTMEFSMESLTNLMELILTLSGSFSITDREETIVNIGGVNRTLFRETVTEFNGGKLIRHSTSENIESGGLATKTLLMDNYSYGYYPDGSIHTISYDVQATMVSEDGREIQGPLSRYTERYDYDQDGTQRLSKLITDSDGRILYQEEWDPSIQGYWITSTQYPTDISELVRDEKGNFLPIHSNQQILQRGDSFAMRALAMLVPNQKRGSVISYVYLDRVFYDQLPESQKALYNVAGIPPELLDVIPMVTSKHNLPQLPDDPGNPAVDDRTLAMREEFLSYDPNSGTVRYTITSPQIETMNNEIAVRAAAGRYAPARFQFVKNYNISQDSSGLEYRSISLYINGEEFLDFGAQYQRSVAGFIPIFGGAGTAVAGESYTVTLFDRIEQLRDSDVGGDGGLWT
ncbi:MAG TPA: hypothetical protein ENN78_01095, partial [Candidatus Omnitrophica bacterium]|nr:hypothetical protein [Candidatus Omnitrophota bacterium]